MQRIVASMLAIAIAICFSVNVGCSPSDKKPAATTTTTGTVTDKKFAAEKGEGVIEKDKVEVTFKNGKPKTVAPDLKDGIKAAIDGEKAVFSWTGDLPAEAKTAEFTVKGGKDDKEEAVIKITVKAKAKS